jgi:hypothetical protein
MNRLDRGGGPRVARSIEHATKLRWDEFRSVR